jgi:hypothetical protein
MDPIAAIRWPAVIFCAIAALVLLALAWFFWRTPNRFRQRDPMARDAQIGTVMSFLAGSVLFVVLLIRQLLG